MSDGDDRRRVLYESVWPTIGVSLLYLQDGTTAMEISGQPSKGHEDFYFDYRIGVDRSVKPDWKSLLSIAAKKVVRNT